MNNNNMKLTVFKKIRERLGLSQSEFARSIGLEQGSYSGLESGKKGSLTKQTALLLNLVYGVSMDYLCDGVGEIFELKLSAHKIKTEESPIMTGNMSVEASRTELDILQKKVVELLEENMALQKKVIELLEENKKLQEHDSLDYTDMSMGEKMIEEMGEVVKKIAEDAKSVSQRTKKVMPKKAM